MSHPQHLTTVTVLACGPAVPLTPPDSAPAWELILDTTRPDLTTGPAPALAPAQSVLLMRATHARPKGGKP